MRVLHEPSQAPENPASGRAKEPWPRRVPGKEGRPRTRSKNSNPTAQQPQDALHGVQVPLRHSATQQSSAPGLVIAQRADRASSKPLRLWLLLEEREHRLLQALASMALQHCARVL